MGGSTISALLLLLWCFAIGSIAMGLSLRPTTWCYYYGQVYRNTETCTYHVKCSFGRWGAPRCTYELCTNQVVSSKVQYRRCCRGYRGSNCNDFYCDPQCINGKCTGPQTCTCNPGWTGALCDQDANECVDPSSCDHDCNNTVGSFQCSCFTGYQLACNGRNCNDIDECSIVADLCEYNCLNTNGSYECICPPGHQLASDRQRSCIDVDECSSDNGGCSQECNNTIGSYYCTCLNGFTLQADGHTCEDVDECHTTATNSRVCEQVCINTPGGYLCDCRHGFVLEGDSNCTDIDECAVLNGGCDHQCHNGPGFYNCTCDVGYQLQSDNHTCADVDECEQGLCSQGCENNIGSYFCYCNEGFFLSSDGTTCRDKLLLVPRSGTILGGTPVRVYGPCAEEPNDIKCVFGSEEVEGKYYPDQGQFVCVTPRFQNTGRVQFTLTFTSNTGENQTHSTIFSVVPDDQFRQVHIQSRDKVPLTPSTSFELTWSPDIQPFVDPQSYKIDIAAYILDPQEGILEMEKMLASNLTNTGRATVSLDGVQLKRGIDVVPLYVQVAVARLAQDENNGLPAKACFWSAVTYFTTRTALVFACNQWSLRQRDVNASVLLDQVKPCPRTVAQARLPNSNFIADDVDPFGRHIQTSAVFHPSADICFRQRVPKSGTTAGNHCCYRRGNLCTDSECGGTVDKVTPQDWATYLQHTMEDVLPAVYCCKGTFTNCGSYQQKRPIDDGSKSPPPPPVPACVYGDPHVVTLDGHKYTFNGKGEYTLIATDDDSFTLQGRMVEALNREGENSAATVYSALVGRMTDSDTVQIELRPTGLVALVNDEEIAFKNNGTEVLEFQNVLIQDHGKDTVSAFFANGAYFEVKEENDIISVVIVSLPVAFRGKTSGLMGNFNGNTSDDLTPKGGGEPIPLNSSLEVIHEQFGITWIIDGPDNSLFSYEEGKSWADYFDPDFTPAYQPIFTDPALEERAMEICGDDQFCVFDIAATEREEVGMSTMQGNLDLEVITELSQPVVCNPLCANGTGVCVANNTCSCAPGYFGDTCSQQDFQPCVVNVCENGGTCTQSVDLVKCDCPEGFAGKQCQTAFTTPRVTSVAKTAGGYVIRWFISPRVAARVQNFRVTVFQLGSNDLGDDQITDIPHDSVYSDTVRTLYITSLTEGYQYHVEVSASVGGVYGPPGAVDITF